MPRRRLCGGLTLLMRQLIIKPTIDTLTFEPCGSAQIRTLLAGRSSTPSTTDHKFMLREHGKSPDRPDFGHCDSGDETTGRLAYWACRRRRKSCELTDGRHSDVTFFDSRTFGLPCRCSIPCAPPAILRLAHGHVICPHSGAGRSFAPEPSADDLTKAFMIGFHRGERR